VILALNVFHESTYAALLSHGFEKTAEFVNIIWKWWSIVNIQNCLFGQKKRNHLSEPFTTVNDQRFDFLSNLVSWIDNWQKLSHKFKGHILSPDTSKALIQSTNALSCIIRYCLETIKVPYVLPGKFQTDKLEKRFSMYRQFNGGNYNVSVTQVMETEKKLRIKSVLGIKSARYGMVPLDVSNLEVSNDEPDKDTQFSIEYIQRLYEPICEKEQTEDLPPVDMDALIYVSGYASFKLQTKVACKNCVELFLGI
jgi:hypothetical protein